MDTQILFMLIILLVISQLICFYLIFIINSKMAKFKDLEFRQDKIMEEMDNAIGAYLLEMKEENDRFLQELAKLKPPQNVQAEPFKQPIPDHLNNGHPVQLDNGLNQGGKKLPVVPKTVVKNAYIQQQNYGKETENLDYSTKNHEENQQTSPHQEAPKKEMALKEKVLALHEEGKSIEEIAKITQKGKTEIELLLKFQS